MDKFLLYLPYSLLHKCTTMLCGVFFLCGCEHTVVIPYDGSKAAVTPETVFASAIAYPEDYDWRNDPLGGEVDTDLLLLRDGEESLRLQAGEQYEISRESDMHTIVNGHLYTEFSSATETVVKCDGKEIFRFEGREKIVSWLVNNGCVHTLSEWRSGNGWTYRQDGKMIISRSASRLTSHLYPDAGEICFSHSEVISSSGDETEKEQYYLVHDGKEELLIYSADINKIYALRRFNGNTHYIARSSLQNQLIWKDKTKTSLVDCYLHENIRNVEFTMVGEEPVLHMQKWSDSKMSSCWNDYYWTRSALVAATGALNQTCSFCDNAKIFCFAQSPECEAGGVVVKWNGQNYKMPLNMLLLSSRALTCDHSSYYIGLNDSNHAYRPVIINRFDTLKFKFNGFFTQLALP